MNARFRNLYKAHDLEDEDEDRTLSTEDAANRDLVRLNALPN